MATLDRPLLRPLSRSRVEHRSRLCVAFEDSLGLFQGQVLIPIELYQLAVRDFDGTKTLDQIRTRILEENGQDFPLAEMKRLVEQLDRAMVLEGPTLADFTASYARLESRPAALGGRSYPGDPVKLRAELAGFFEHPKGSGSVNSELHDANHPVRAIVCPHIDFGRGGPVYTWAYRELVEKSDADIFVILGVAHQYSKNRFALTHKDFETPLGKVKTDRSFVDTLAEHAGQHLFEDELAHRTEHSIEFQAVFLQYLLGGRRDFTIVPILAGSFHDLMARKVDPIDDPEVRRMVEGLKKAEAVSGKKVAYIGAIDLCHVGPEFGDRAPVDDLTLEQVRAFDQVMLHFASENDPASWFANASAINNRWRVCGLAATYTMLHAIGPVQGRILSYDQAVNQSRSCCVTFASVAFDSVPDHA
jgi:AmmeMemoRadiSam system protein B